MKNILIINAHHPYSFSEGKLNQSLIDIATKEIENAGNNVKHTIAAKDYDINEEVEKHVWADIVILQSPVNWMSTGQSFKKYMDEVYTAGMQGALSNGDGRTEVNPKDGYGTGGTQQGTKYMLSLTLNAPEEAFNNPNHPVLKGMSIDDLFNHIHISYQFFSMEKLPTFAAYDVVKNPDIEKDLNNFKKHLKNYII